MRRYFTNQRHQSFGTLVTMVTSHGGGTAWSYVWTVDAPVECPPIPAAALLRRGADEIELRRRIRRRGAERRGYDLEQAAAAFVPAELGEAAPA